MVNCINLIIEMSPRFILGLKNVPCVAEVVNRSLKADCTNYTREMPICITREMSVCISREMSICISREMFFYAREMKNSQYVY